MARDSKSVAVGGGATWQWEGGGASTDHAAISEPGKTVAHLGGNWGSCNPIQLIEYNFDWILYIFIYIYIYQYFFFKSCLKGSRLPSISFDYVSSDRFVIHFLLLAESIWSHLQPWRDGPMGIDQAGMTSSRGR